MKDQVKRLAFPEFLATAEQTGHFSWKSLDWASWIQTPSKWATGARVAIAFQRFTQSSPHPEVSTEVANRTKKNEKFYSKLDKELDHELLLPGKGSVYIARTSNEKTSLMNMQQGLTKEKRAFPMLSESEIVKEFGYRPQGEAFAKKVHDRVLSPNFISLLSNRITRSGGNVLNACVTSVYANNPEDGGVVEYQVEGDEKKHYIQFKKLVMSLGTQQILGVDNAPIFDIVSARGVSAIALIRLPKGATLPAVVVCGETNHVTKLAGPLDINGENVVLARMTCGACITPTSDSANYDGAAALGLRKAVSKTLNAQVEILSTYGCNRQVSQYGQTHWLEVNKQLKTNSHGLTPRGDAEDVGTSLPTKLTGIFIQYGAGGGGLTQAPSQPSF
jgi:hypothetical protein